MRFILFMAARYLLSKRRHPFVRVSSIVSVAGIMVGVAALIVVMAVMSGFDKDLKDKILGSKPDILIWRDGAMPEASALRQKIDTARDRRIASVCLYKESQALFQASDLSSGVLVRAVDVPHEQVGGRFFSKIKDGDLPEKGQWLVVGSELMKKFSLSTGSSVSLISQSSKKPKKLVISGVYESGIYDYDANMVFVNQATASELFGPNDFAVALYLKNSVSLQAVASTLREKLNFSYRVETWREQNKTFFAALSLEKAVMFLILSLIILVACLNVSGSLVTLVMDKTRDIGVLKALGVLDRDIAAIFSVQGFFLGFIGATLGLLMGLLVLYVLNTYPVIVIPKEIYYFDKLPVNINFMDVSNVYCVAILLSVISAVYPAILASRLEIVKALRHE